MQYKITRAEGEGENLIVAEKYKRVEKITGKIKQAKYYNGRKMCLQIDKLKGGKNKTSERVRCIIVKRLF